MTTMYSGRPGLVWPPCSRRSATASPARWCCFSTGSVGQVSGVCSANRALTAASIRAESLTPVTGSNRPDRHHMPSASVQVRTRTARRCRVNLSMPSSRWMLRTSTANRRRQSSTVATAATSSKPRSSRSNNSSRCSPSRCLVARVTSSTCPAVTAPSSNASASDGAASRVRERSRSLIASFADPRVQSAIVFSGNDTCAASFDVNAAFAPVSHDCSRPTSRNAASRSVTPAAVSARTAVTRSTRSTTTPMSMVTVMLRGYHTVSPDKAGWGLRL
jgi:hypothetical protein